MPQLGKALTALRVSTAHAKARVELSRQLGRERQTTELFLIDKFVPVLTAILGGIAYVLLGHKISSFWALNSFRASGCLLTLAVLVVFLRTWLQPFRGHAIGLEELEIRAHFLNQVGQQKGRSDKSINYGPFLRRYRRQELVPLSLITFFVVGGLVLAAVAVGIESSMTNGPLHTQGVNGQRG